MPGTSTRGFASMEPTKQREIASKGGKAAHAKGTAHEFTPEEARVAGAKGGRISRQRRMMNLSIRKNPEQGFNQGGLSPANTNPATGSVHGTVVNRPQSLNRSEEDSDEQSRLTAVPTEHRSW